MESVAGGNSLQGLKPESRVVVNMDWTETCLRLNFLSTFPRGRDAEETKRVSKKCRLISSGNVSS
jgi:hypothetical protein